MGVFGEHGLAPRNDLWDTGPSPCTVEDLPVSSSLSFGILTILDHFMHLITNLDHFGYANTSVFINSSNNDKSGSFYLQIWIIFTSFILVGRWIRGRAQRNHVLTHVVFGPKVFSLAGRIHLLLGPKVFSLAGPFLGPKCDWDQN